MKCLWASANKQCPDNDRNAEVPWFRNLQDSSRLAELIAPNRQVSVINDAIAIGIARTGAAVCSETSLPRQKVRSIDSSIEVEIRVLNGSSDDSCQ